MSVEAPIRPSEREDAHWQKRLTNANQKLEHAGVEFPDPDAQLDADDTDWNDRLNKSNRMLQMNSQVAQPNQLFDRLTEEERTAPGPAAAKAELANQRKEAGVDRVIDDWEDRKDLSDRGQELIAPQPTAEDDQVAFEQEVTNDIEKLFSGELGEAAMNKLRIAVMNQIAERNTEVDETSHDPSMN